MSSRGGGRRTTPLIWRRPHKGPRAPDDLPGGAGDAGDAKRARCARTSRRQSSRPSSSSSKLTTFAATGRSAFNMPRYTEPKPPSPRSSLSKSREPASPFKAIASPSTGAACCFRGEHATGWALPLTAPSTFRCAPGDRIIYFLNRFFSHEAVRHNQQLPLHNQQLPSLTHGTDLSLCWHPTTPPVTVAWTRSATARS